MSTFCCGASKIGKVASYQKESIAVHHVPVLYCPVCLHVEPHPKVKENLDIIIDIAKGDGLRELDLNYYLSFINYEELFELCSTIDKGNKDEVIQSQIDISLDLLSFSRIINDREWEDLLKKRLSILSTQKDVTRHK